MPIASIIRDPRMQIREGGTNPAKVKEYATAYRTGVEMPPVEVAAVDGALYLVDGWHRLAALERNGEANVLANVTAVASVKEVAGLAALSNRGHGVPLTLRDRRVAFKLYMRSGQYRRRGGRAVKTLREIARELGGGTSHNTISGWMKEFCSGIWERNYQDEEGTGGGGGGLRGRRAFGTPFDNALRGVEQVQAAFAGVTSANKRGEVIAKMREAVEAMETAGGWTPYEPDELEF